MKNSLIQTKFYGLGPEGCFHVPYNEWIRVVLMVYMILIYKHYLFY
jgi:hypothetical protein